jgi:hypothetical protein
MWKNMPHVFRSFPNASGKVVFRFRLAQVVTFNALLNACERARFPMNCLAQNMADFTSRKDIRFK